ncbi:hypothetical protein K4749_11215 [Streptomyces sp. TRM72054]|uniref:hypothetical protein n=1 Tax=Streptomyces sp. TRM72054 TaxID=2870562 RepID=UPI001C8C909B|nr:hypothetical protein [Streptomyces sp. TRM72054]MBX9394150.1 hypothetical protein [Streptomyces sp. TRM72054]
MKSEDTPFEGGPMDGRVLPVLLGLTGHPPKTYRIPVPDPHGGPPTVLIYRRVPRGQGRFTRRWKYVHDPAGDQGGWPRWPWRRPDATPGGKPDDADG